ncbi:MAG TPA: ROK family protein [Acidimicrobiia bacterium]|nr:ROK family protein [Acidimicrobiia bacterium]
MIRNKRVPNLTDHRSSEGVVRRKGIAAEELRRHNLSAVLDRLHVAGPMSRSRLAAQTGLNRSTIRDLLNELGELGLVVEDRGPSGAGPGRPSSVARVIPSGAAVLAIDLEVDSMAVAAVGIGGEIFDEIRISQLEGGPISPEDAVAAVVRLVPPILASLPPGHRLVGAGAGVAGVVRRSDGFVHLAPNLGWRDVPLGAMLAEGLQIDRVMLANEADLGALAEFRRGAGRGSRNMIFVTGEVGVGIGIIYEGRPMLGASGYAGEAGHTIINPSGSRCRCGSIGCWETEVGEEAVIRRAGLEGRRGVEAMDEIVGRADGGDGDIIKSLEEVGGWIGLGVGSLINTFNPDLVVLGGFYERIYPWIEGPAIRAAHGVALEAPWAATEIRSGQLGPDAILTGAAELVIGEVVADPGALRSAEPATTTS